MGPVATWSKILKGTTGTSVHTGRGRIGLEHSALMKPTCGWRFHSQAAIRVRCIVAGMRRSSRPPLHTRIAAVPVDDPTRKIISCSGFEGDQGGCMRLYDGYAVRRLGFVRKALEVSKGHLQAREQ